MQTIDKKELEIEIISALKTVFDPEIPVNVYDLGLIYEIRIDDSSHVFIKMTLTNPNCPVADTLPQEIKQAALGVSGVSNVDIELVFEPAWSKDMISDAALLDMGLL
jgi:FeS assembly SUF system protein